MKAFLSDITGQGALRIAGADASRFLSTMFAGDMGACSQLGELVQGAFLNGEAEVIDIATVLRTGDDEFLVTGSSDNRPELFEWLAAHAALSDGAGKVFPDLAVEDESEHLGILLMAGDGARRAYEDLLGACAGRVPLIQYEFTRPAYGIFCVPSWLVIAPVNSAAQIGDFLYGYSEFYVLGEEELMEMLEEAGAYFPCIHEAAYADAHDAMFDSFIREGADFVGARALGR